MQDFSKGTPPQREVSLRRTDLVHSRDATLIRLEELLALARIEPSGVEAHEWGGYTLGLASSQRFLLWWETRSNVRHHLLLFSSQLDDLGTQLVVSQELINKNPANPFHRPLELKVGAYASVTPWFNQSKAIAFLRRQCVGPELVRAYGATDLFSFASKRIIQDLKLVEGSLNSVALPNYCETSWGILVRVEEAAMPRTVEYFDAGAAARAPDHSIAAVDDLGGGICAVYGFSAGANAPEAMRIALCPRQHEALGVHHLTEWLKNQTSQEEKAQLASSV